MFALNCATVWGCLKNKNLEKRIICEKKKIATDLTSYKILVIKMYKTHVEYTAHKTYHTGGWTDTNISMIDIFV